MKKLNNVLIIENESDIELLTDLVMSDESFEEIGSFIKDGKKYYTQTYNIDFNNKEICIEVFVNWEDKSEICEIDFFIGQEFLIR